MIWPDCKKDYNPELNHECTHEKVAEEYPTKVAQSIKFEVLHPDWQYDIKISNDNTKGEKRVTVHVRADTDIEKVMKLAHKAYIEELRS